MPDDMYHYIALYITVSLLATIYPVWVYNTDLINCVLTYLVTYLYPNNIVKAVKTRRQVVGDKWGVACLPVGCDGSEDGWWVRRPGDVADGTAEVECKHWFPIITQHQQQNDVSHGTLSVALVNGNLKNRKKTRNAWQNPACSPRGIAVTHGSEQL